MSISSRPRLALAVLCSALALVVAACGDDNSGGGGGSSSSGKKTYNQYSVNHRRKDHAG